MWGTQGVLNGPKVAVKESTLGQLVYDALKKATPNTVVLIDAHTKAVLTYGDLLHRSIGVACSLKGMGVCQDDIVALVSNNCLNYTVPVVASHFLGAIVQLVNPTWNLRELQHIFNISKPKWIICSEATLDLMNTMKTKFDSITDVVLLNALVSSSKPESSFEPTAFNPVESTAIIYASSGTTGVPKAVMTTHQNIVETLQNWMHPHYGNYQKGDVTVVPMPLYHMFGMNMLLVSIFSFVKCVIIDRFSPNLYLSTIERYRANKIACPPSLIFFLAKHPMVENYDLSSISDVISSSAPLKWETEQQLASRMKVMVRQCFAMTETTGATNIVPVGAKKQGSCGVLLPNIVAKVRDPTSGRTLKANQSGEICFKGPTLMKGYMNNKEVNKSSFDEEGFFLTGDFGYFDKDGFLFIVDRLKDLIKFRGHQVAPADLESVLMLHPAVKDAAVIGIPDERDGELTFAYVVKQDGRDVSKEDILEFFNERVSVRNKLYGGLDFIESIPRTQNGKILKKNLKQLKMALM